MVDRWLSLVHLVGRGKSVSSPLLSIHQSPYHQNATARNRHVRTVQSECSLERVAAHTRAQRLTVRTPHECYYPVKLKPGLRPGAGMDVMRRVGESPPNHSSGPD
jgi:hypothetical protein